MTTSETLRALQSMLEDYRQGPVNGLLDLLERSPDAQSVAAVHEALLFVRAYPRNAETARRSEAALRRFGKRIKELRNAEANLEPLEEPEISGIAATGVSAVFGYGLARDLAARYPVSIEVDWDYYEKQHHLGRELPAMIPLLQEDALVEAAIPYREWLERAAGGGSVLGWLMRRLAEAPHTEAARFFDSLELMLRWEFGRAACCRTLCRRPAKRKYYHCGPLLRRRDVDLAAELDRPGFPLERLTRKAGREALELMRDSSAVRYRELHGFTYGDPARVFRVDAGRGTQVLLTVIPPAHRLPLRAYHGGMCFKNGVPIGYVEGLSLLDRMEIGFNLYYTFRDGETAWLYAVLLRHFHRWLGIRYFVLDRYQIGHENEEAIASGAFWFYRKLGFRPVLPEPARLCEREESRLLAKPGSTTAAAVLRRLAAGPMIYETTGAPPGQWDRFEVRRIGLAVQDWMAGSFDGSSARLREAVQDKARKLFDIDLGALPAAQGLAAAVCRIPAVESWTPRERELANQILKAKAGPDERRYLKLSQKHEPLRAGLQRLGAR